MDVPHCVHLSAGSMLKRALMQGWFHFCAWTWTSFRVGFTMCDNPNEVFLPCNSPKLAFRFTFNFPFSSRLIQKKRDFKPLLASHKKGICPLKRAFLGESQRPERRLSNQISSFELETH